MTEKSFCGRRGTVKRKNFYRFFYICNEYRFKTALCEYYKISVDTDRLCAKGYFPIVKIPEK